MCVFIIRVQVMLRVKESEVQYLKQEINSLKEELQAAQRVSSHARSAVSPFIRGGQGPEAPTPSGPRTSVTILETIRKRSLKNTAMLLKFS